MYWQTKGKHNTDATVELALKAARELDVRHIVVASNSGKTAEKLIGKGVDVVCVSHHVGFLGPGEDEMPQEMRKHLAANGIMVLTTTHLFAGLDRAIRNKFGGVYPAEIMAQTLRMFGQGVKVCVEISGMALDAGLIPHGSDIIAIGGSATGADTAIVIRPAHSNKFFETEIKQIICKPLEV